MKVAKVVAIVTHSRELHIDEARAIMDVRKFGEKFLPGIMNAPVIFWETDGETIDGRPWEKWWEEGYIMIGIGGGPLDEHSTMSEEQKDKECAASLVVKELGITDSAIVELVEAIRHEDKEGSKSPFDLHGLFRAIQRNSKDDTLVMAWASTALESLENFLRNGLLEEGEEILSLKTVTAAVANYLGNEPDVLGEWFSSAMEAKVNEQKTFFVEGRKNFEENGEVHDIILSNGKTEKLVVIENCWSDQAAAYARFVTKAAVILTIDPNGFMFISGSKKHGAWLSDVIAMIRVEEQRSRNVKTTWDFKELRSSGKVAGAENWMFHKKMNIVFNGRRGKGVTKTKISYEKLNECLCYGLNNQEFLCDGKSCRHNNSNGNYCPWHAYGLPRCSALRYKQASAQTAPRQGTPKKATVTA